MSFNPRPGASSTPTSDSDDMALDDIEDGIGISTGSGVVLDYNEHPSLDPAIRSHLARTNNSPATLDEQMALVADAILNMEGLVILFAEYMEGDNLKEVSHSQIVKLRRHTPCASHITLAHLIRAIEDQPGDVSTFFQNINNYYADSDPFVGGSCRPIPFSHDGFNRALFRQYGRFTHAARPETQTGTSIVRALVDNSDELKKLCNEAGYPNNDPDFHPVFAIYLYYQDHYPPMRSLFQSGSTDHMSSQSTFPFPTFHMNIYERQPNSTQDRFSPGPVDPPTPLEPQSPLLPHADISPASPSPPPSQNPFIFPSNPSAYPPGSTPTPSMAHMPFSQSNPALPPLPTTHPDPWASLRAHILNNPTLLALSHRVEYWFAASMYETPYRQVRTGQVIEQFHSALGVDTRKSIYPVIGGMQITAMVLMTYFRRRPTTYSGCRTMYRKVHEKCMALRLISNRTESQDTLLSILNIMVREENVDLTTCVPLGLEYSTAKMVEREFNARMAAS
ncbi:hypothetical protein VNI00_018097 [Paramarasmius palmivorus]|uniref:Uncharacterized protein n=1 Tax=Paramarasmius palmivorus TaxID=297713 RepID=A0AAW0B3L1_9AGAR